MNIKVKYLILRVMTFVLSLGFINFSCIASSAYESNDAGAIKTASIQQGNKLVANEVSANNVISETTVYSTSLANQLSESEDGQAKYLLENNNVNYWAIVPAAGFGIRMNNKTFKQYLKIQDKEIIIHSINKLLATNIFSKIVVVLPENDNYFETLDIANDNRIMTTTGGLQRYNSVFNGIKEIQNTQNYSPNDWVLVHDAVRPCCNIQDINSLINTLQNNPVGGILGYPASDTIKIVDSNDNIECTPDRSMLWHAVTPQMFRMGILSNSLEHCIEQNIIVTDEASAVEMYGYKPKIIRSNTNNIKVTYDKDAGLAEYYLSQNKEELQ